MNILKSGFVALLAVIVASAVVWAPAPGAVAAESRAGAQDASIPREQVLVLARVSRRVARHQPRVEAFADWLASQMAHVGIRAGAGHIARSPREMIDLLRTGRVDVVSESVLTALSYEDKAGAEILFHEWRSGRPYYSTVFITARATKIFSLDDLRGRRIAFEDPGSTSGYLLPMAALIEAGLKPVRLDSITQPVPAGHVGYVFAQSEANITAWTVRGLVDAGAYADNDWRHKRHTPKRDRKQLRIFHQTPPLMRSVFLVRKGLPDRVRAALLDVLGKFGSLPEHEAVGKRYYKISRFGKLESAKSKELAKARKIYRTINPLLD